MAISESAPTLQRFRFASFDEKEEAKVTAPEKVEKVSAKALPTPAPAPMPLPLTLPAFTEKDIQAARNEGMAQGTREGYAAAQAKFDKESANREETIKSLLEIIANRITIAAENHTNALKERETLMAKLVMAAARKVAGEALKKEPYAAVESLIQESMGLIAGVPNVTVVVSIPLASGLRQRIDMLKPLLLGFSGTIKVEEDGGLMDQDCRVEWGNGYSERDTEDMWRTIEAIVAKTNVNS